MVGLIVIVREDLREHEKKQSEEGGHYSNTTQIKVASVHLCDDYMHVREKLSSAIALRIYTMSRLYHVCTQ